MSLGRQKKSKGSCSLSSRSFLKMRSFVQSRIRIRFTEGVEEIPRTLSSQADDKISMHKEESSESATF